MLTLLLCDSGSHCTARGSHRLRQEFTMYLNLSGSSSTLDAKKSIVAAINCNESQLGSCVDLTFSLKSMSDRRM